VPSARLVVVWVRENSPLQDNYVDILYRQQTLHPGCAVGFGGWMVDTDSSANDGAESEGGAESVVRRDQLHLRSAAAWADVDIVPVDVLDYVSGVIFERRMFGRRIDEEGLLPKRNPLHYGHDGGKGHSSRCPHHKTEDSDEEVRVSATLAYKGIPRLAVPMDMARVRPMTDSTASVPNGELLYRPSPCHIYPLLSYFQMSWVAPSDRVNNEAECSALLDKRFRPIPVVDNLPGFSWQVNWDADSATSPCTTHLMTRIVSGVSLMGVGQYMNEGQVIRAPGGGFELELEKGAVFCFYNVSSGSGGDTEERRGRIGCLGHPSPPLKTLCDGETAHYAAILDGELCVFCGDSPGIGSSRAESGHGRIEWCTSDVYPPRPAANLFNQSHPVENKKMGAEEEGLQKETRRLGGSERVLLGEQSDRMARIKARIREKISTVKAARHSEQLAECHRRDHFPKDQWELLYLHTSDDGLFGLYIGNSIDAHALSNPKLRAQYLLAGRCFAVNTT
jgi:hypothetical protein